MFGIEFPAVNSCNVLVSVLCKHKFDSASNSLSAMEKCDSLVVCGQRFQNLVIVKSPLLKVLDFSSIAISSMDGASSKSTQSQEHSRRHVTASDIP